MNKVILMGNLTRDPEIRYTPKGQAVCEFALAVNEKWKTEFGEVKERVTFLECFCWGARGEAFAKHHRKGSKALVDGKIVQETWDDKETGKKRSKTRIQVESWEFVSGSPQGAANAQDGPTQRPPAEPKSAASVDQPNPAPREEDDVPF